MNASLVRPNWERLLGPMATGLACAVVPWLALTGILMTTGESYGGALVIILLVFLVGGALGGLAVEATARWRDRVAGRSLIATAGVVPFFGLFTLLLLIEGSFDATWIFFVAPVTVVMVAALIGDVAVAPPEMAISRSRTVAFHLARVTGATLVVETAVMITLGLLFPSPGVASEYALFLILPVFLPATSLALALCGVYVLGVYFRSWHVHRSEWICLGCMLGAVGMKPVWGILVW